MKERIRKVMEYARMTQQDFANRLGISPSSLSSIFTGRTNPGLKQVMAIQHAFPEINTRWLMFGEGEMTIAPSSDQKEDDADDKISEKMPENHQSSQSARSLFDGDPLGVSHASPAQVRQGQWVQPELNLPYRQNVTALQMPKNIDKLSRKIKEIRVFFDDGTYESFVPSSK